MDKQREEFERWWEEFESIHPEWKYADADAIRLQVWQAAQAAMQPKIDKLASDKDELNDLAEKQEQQLSTAKHRIEELEKDYAVWREYTGKVNDRNIELEERICVASKQ